MDERRKRFCEYYVGECVGNVAQAALKSGYSQSYSYHRAHSLLENVEVKEYIKELSKAGTQERIATAEEVKSFWSDIMNDTSEATKDRLKASELLAKVLGLFNDW